MQRRVIGPGSSQEVSTIPQLGTGSRAIAKKFSMSSNVKGISKVGGYIFSKLGLGKFGGLDSDEG